MNWEYQEEEVSTIYVALEQTDPARHPGGEYIWVDMADRSLHELLQSRGAEGWELVGFTPARLGPDMSIIPGDVSDPSARRLFAQAIFKRPVE
jgi:hypothetical protein